MKKALTILWVLFLLMPSIALADEDESALVYQLLDENGETLTWYAGVPDPGDEYVTGDNWHYRVMQADPDAKLARTESLGRFELPDVSWLDEDSQPVSATKKAVAIYCTHSDESYEPGDGTSSKEQRGGIYDVAEKLKAALEKKGVTVYYSDENHYPHDAGAYRRSRATAASLAEEGVDAIFDVHRDGIPDASQYESTVKGEDVTKVRLLVGRQNQNADANKQFAAQIKAVADKLYPGLVKDIYMGKGSYNQDLMSQAVLLEFGTHKSDKNEVLASTSYMADVLNRALYGGVTGAAGKEKSPAKENSGGWTGVGWLVVIGLAALFLYAFAASGNLQTAGNKMKRSFQEMTGGLLGGRHDDGGDE
ncbi:MAG: stage II sporulation protein P [Clostridia bacterium]|nr:stage II sporulation protein P [Clostridia bacterium]MBR0408287.1 stage II sporulation protein P [Clostridia bacterium]